MVNDHSDSCRHIGYTFRLAARVLLYASSQRQDNTYHGLCYTSRGAWLEREIAQWIHPMKDRSDNPSHLERTPLPRSYISLLTPNIISICISDQQTPVFQNPNHRYGKESITSQLKKADKQYH